MSGLDGGRIDVAANPLGGRTRAGFDAAVRHLYERVPFGTSLGSLEGSALMSVVQEQRGRVLVVRIEREEKRNAIDMATARGIDEALNRLDDDPGLWAGVLTGTAAVFSAGTDLGDRVSASTERGGEYGVIRRRRVKPLIAAVEGPAYGGGFEIALACDLIVAATTARFALPESLRGVVASSGALFRVMRSLPPNLARELLLTGAVLDAERAYSVGLVNRLAAPGGAVDDAVAMAEEICLSSPVSIRATLAALGEQVEEDDARGWAATGHALETVLASEDLLEGIEAFFERRRPVWRGR